MLCVWGGGVFSFYILSFVSYATKTIFLKWVIYPYFANRVKRKPCSIGSFCWACLSSRSSFVERSNRLEFYSYPITWRINRTHFRNDEVLIHKRQAMKSPAQKIKDYHTHAQCYTRQTPNFKLQELSLAQTSEKPTYIYKTRYLIADFTDETYITRKKISVNVHTTFSSKSIHQL